MTAEDRARSGAADFDFLLGHWSVRHRRLARRLARCTEWIEFMGAWSTSKRAALAAVGSLAMARVFLQTRTRYWLAQGSNGWAFTDDPMDVWTTRAISLGRAESSARISAAAWRCTRAPFFRGNETRSSSRRMERVHPGLRDQLETAAAYSWIADPWALGASALFDAGQLSAHYRSLRAPEGRIHFAGEHTSPWTGWMNGALESGERAAVEIATRAIG